MKDAWIPGYFDTRYRTVLQIEQILHNFEDQKIANFFKIEQVNFRVTLVIYVKNWQLKTYYLPVNAGLFFKYLFLYFCGILFKCHFVIILLENNI